MENKKKVLNTESKILNVAKKSLSDDKGLDLKVINIKKKTSIADYMIITSGTSKRHVTTMAKNLQEKIKKKLKFTPKLEGVEKGEWVLIDANSTIINIFKPEIRNFYKLEKIWQD